MAAKDGKDKVEGLPTLSQAEFKLIALGVKYALGGGKVDYEKIAKHGGYTKGSAQVMYRKALRKLTDSLGESDDVVDETVESSERPTPVKTPKTPRTPGSRKSTKRAKDVAEQTAAEAPYTPTAPDADGVTNFLSGAGALDDSDADAAPVTPSKRAKRSPTKKAAAKSNPTTPKVDEPIVKDEGESDIFVKTE